MDMMEMRYYIAVFEEKRITKAADRLFVSQQQISKVIKRIESELGAALFVRTNTGFVPTQDGKEAYRRFNRIISEFDELKAVVSNSAIDTEGKLCVMMDVGICQLLTRAPLLSFKKKYPHIEFIIEEHREHNCKRLTDERRGDVGITICTHNDEKYNNYSICALNAELLVNSKHPLAGRQFATVEDIVPERILFPENATYYTFHKEYAVINDTPKILIAITEPKLSYEYVLDNQGILPSVFTNRRKETSPPKGMTVVPYKPKAPIILTGYWRKEENVPLLGGLFFEHLKEYYNR